MRIRRNLFAVGAGAVAAMLWMSTALAADQQAADKEVLRALSRAISSVVAEVSPAVVSIYTTKVVKLRTPDRPELAPMFEEFFGRKLPREMMPQQREFRRRGLGSGFIIDAEKGYILTNNHVVDGADDIRVRLPDKQELAGKLIGADKQTDLAVVQIDAKDLHALPLGDSDRLEVGEFVIAIGCPFGLRETVSSGIVSATGRSNLGIEDYEDFIQTDAAINVGNSGGPLLNIEGEVVGVNTAIFSRTGGSVGVGFAIPINMAKDVIKQLVETGKVTRGFLGVMIQDLTPDLAKKLDVKESEGVVVSQVNAGTPAADAGIEPGDVIVEYGGESVANVAKLRAKVAVTRPGSEAKIVVVRGGERKSLTVKVAELTDSAIAAVRGGGSAESLGLSVQDLTPEIARSLGIRAAGGVAVTTVDDAGPAAAEGIQAGDVILEVNRRPVRNAQEFQAALAKADLRDGILLLVANRAGNRFVVVRPQDNE